MRGTSRRQCASDCRYKRCAALQQSALCRAVVSAVEPGRRLSRGPPAGKVQRMRTPSASTPADKGTRGRSVQRIVGMAAARGRHARRTLCLGCPSGRPSVAHLMLQPMEGRTRLSTGRPARVQSRALRRSSPAVGAGAGAEVGERLAACRHLPADNRQQARAASQRFPSCRLPAFPRRLTSPTWAAQPLTGDRDIASVLAGAAVVKLACTRTGAQTKGLLRRHLHRRAQSCLWPCSMHAQLPPLLLRPPVLRSSVS